MSLLTTIEPSELEKGFVSAEDRKIIAEDKPERFQVLRFDYKKCYYVINTFHRLKS